jgi:hypothetical protein
VAFAHGIAKIAAGTGIHGRSQHESRGKGHGDGCAGDCYGPVFERLAHDFEHVALKFRQLIEKENAIVTKRNLPGRGTAPPPIKPASLIVW